jgi:pyrroline-5-carboxylate reductase
MISVNNGNDPVFMAAYAVNNLTDLNCTIKGVYFEMKIGTIGTGNIASAVVTGFCLKDNAHRFFLSPRNAEKSAALAEQFSNTSVCVSNQEVLDNAEWVFIAIHRKDFDILNSLDFKAEHKVVNMAAELELDDLRNRIGETALLAHAIPLPMIACGYGPLIAFPESGELEKLFSPISDVLFAKDLGETRTLQLITGIMSPYYMLLNEIVEFATAQDLDRSLSINFVHSLFTALSKRATKTESCDLVKLAHDMTPGGYNEQAMKELLASGAIKAWNTALNNLLDRLNSVLLSSH